MIVTSLHQVAVGRSPTCSVMQYPASGWLTQIIVDQWAAPG